MLAVIFQLQCVSMLHSRCLRVLLVVFCLAHFVDAHPCLPDTLPLSPHRPEQKQVSQHPRCRLRIAVVGRAPGDKGLAALRAALK